MPDRLLPCKCGVLTPVSVSISADENRLWQAVLECPACGGLEKASAHDAIPALIRAAICWNTRVAQGRLYLFPKRR